MNRRTFLGLAAGTAVCGQAPPPVHFKWRFGPEYPSYVKGGAMARVGDAVVYAGGMTQPWRESEAAWYLRPENKDWRPLPPMPKGRAYTHGAGAEDSLIVVGGRWRGHATADVFRLRRAGPDDWHWDVLPSLTEPRATAGVGAAGSRIVAVGGGDWDRQVGGAFAPRMVGRVEVLDLKRLDAGWRQAAAFPGGPCVAAMVASIGGKIYHFGGYDLWYEQAQRHIEIKNSAWSYDVDSDRWEALPALPRRMYGGACAALGDRYIVLMGGVVEDEDGRREMGVLVDPKRKLILGQYSTSVLVYDTVARVYQWSKTPVPRGHNDIRAATLDGKIYVVGGENADVTLSNTTSDVLIAEIQ
jgi:hypothetical protein